jgi:hypothetical protein
VLETVQRAGPHGASKEQIVQALYGEDYAGAKNAAAVLLYKLNKKLATVDREIACGSFPAPMRYRLTQYRARRR